MDTKELISFLNDYDDLKIFVNAGYNRFNIENAIKYDDHIVLYTSEDADNPIEEFIPPPKISA